jgi:hypothetical protein
MLYSCRINQDSILPTIQAGTDEYHDCPLTSYWTRFNHEYQNNCTRPILWHNLVANNAISNAIPAKQKYKERTARQPSENSDFLVIPPSTQGASSYYINNTCSLTLFIPNVSYPLGVYLALCSTFQKKGKYNSGDSVQQGS